MMIGIKKIRLRIKWYLLAGVVFTNSLSLHAQKGRNITITNVKTKIQDNSLEIITEDSCTVINLIASYIRPELRKNIWQDIDKTRKYIYQAMAMAQKINYIQGIHDLRRCLGSAYTAKGPQDSAQFYLRYSIKQMEEIKDTARICFFLWQYARSCRLSSKFDTAIYVTQKAAQYALAMRDSTAYLDYVSSLPMFYVESGDFVKGAKSSLQNIELAKQFNDTFNVVINARYLAKVYSSMGLYDREMDAAITALNYGGNSNDVRINFNAYMAISEAHYHQHHYDTAIMYAWKNISLFYGGGQNLSHLTLGAIYRDQGLLDSAIFHIKNFIDATAKFKLHEWAEPYYLRGTCAYASGNFKEAIEWFLKAEAELEPQDRIPFRGIYKSLFQCYDTLQHPQKALQFLKQYLVLEDSMQLSQKTFSLAMLEFEKETEYLHRQIALLAENNQLQTALSIRERKQKKLLYASFPLIFCIMLFGFIRYKKQKEVKSKQALLNERLRISRELHDEVGSTLSGIAMYSHVARQQVKHARQEEADESLTMMQKSAGEMVHKLSDIVWLIHPEHNTIANLFERLEDFARQSAAAKNMQVIVDLPETLSDVHIPLEARRNIYLFCKEALNNAVKYSRGATLKLLVTQQRDSLIFSVSDDGCGFDSFTIRKGNGLVNLEKRAEEIGAQFRLVSRPGEGTSVELQYATVS